MVDPLPKDCPPTLGSTILASGPPIGCAGGASPHSVVPFLVVMRRHPGHHACQPRDRASPLARPTSSTAPALRRPSSPARPFPPRGEAWIGALGGRKRRSVAANPRRVRAWDALEFKLASEHHATYNVSAQPWLERFVGWQASYLGSAPTISCRSMSGCSLTLRNPSRGRSRSTTRVITAPRRAISTMVVTGLRRWIKPAL